MVDLSPNDIRNIAKEAQEASDDPRIISSEPDAKYHVFIAMVAKAMEATRVVELGTYQGETSKQVGLLCPKAEVITIDTNQDAKRIIDTIDPIVPNVQAYVDNAEHFIKNGNYDGIPIDLLFIDTTTNYEHVIATFNIWKQFVRVGGIIIFDDWIIDDDMVRIRDAIVNRETNEAFAYDIVEVNKLHHTGMAVLITKNK